MKFSSIIRCFLTLIFIAGFQNAFARRTSPSNNTSNTSHDQTPYTYAPATPASPLNHSKPYSAIPSIPMPAPMPATSSSIPKPDMSAILPAPIKAINNRNQPLIVIDPGHGGDDYGTHSLTKPQYHEKYLNLTTAKMLKQFLENYGYRVIMTRTNDTFISLDGRAQFANDRQAKIFVSVHYNSAPSTDAEGVEVFYYRTDNDKLRVNESKLLAQCVLDKILKNTKANSRGVKHGNFAVIRHTKMPAILVEGGFLTNTQEMNKIKTIAYQKKITHGIAQGIKDFFAREHLLAER